MFVAIVITLRQTIKMGMATLAASAQMAGLMIRGFLMNTPANASNMKTRALKLSLKSRE